jgi:hypothetical protein
MLLTKPGHFHLREEENERCLKVADFVAEIGDQNSEAAGAIF